MFLSRVVLVLIYTVPAYRAIDAYTDLLYCYDLYSLVHSKCFPAVISCSTGSPLEFFLRLCHPSLSFCQNVFCCVLKHGHLTPLSFIHTYTYLCIWFSIFVAFHHFHVLDNHIVSIVNIAAYTESLLSSIALSLSLSDISQCLVCGVFSPTL